MTTKQTVLDFFAAETEEIAKRRIYKYSDCGAWLAFYDWGVEIGSIVEGADFGTAIYPLRYADNFTDADIEARIKAVEKEAAAIWNWANEGPEGSNKTWADIGMDAPDIAIDFQHLGQKGRST